MEETSEEQKVRCIIRLDAIVVFRSGDRCSSAPISRTIMNIRALMMDAPAPVANEYIVQIAMHQAERNIFALGLLPIIVSILEMIM